MTPPRTSFTTSFWNQKEILFDSKEKEILSGPKEKEILSGPKEKEILSGSKEKEILSDSKAKKILSDSKAKKILSGFKAKCKPRARSHSAVPEWKPKPVSVSDRIHKEMYSCLLPRSEQSRTALKKLACAWRNQKF